jgi:hypothetical protein
LLAATGGVSLPDDDASELTVAALGIIFATMMLTTLSLLFFRSFCASGI